jgi:hypothetical protein
MDGMIEGISLEEAQETRVARTSRGEVWVKSFEVIANSKRKLAEEESKG